MSPCLYLRADAGASIGWGHIMRCLSLAEVAVERGSQVELLGQFGGPRLTQRVARVGARVTLLERMHPDPSDLQMLLTKVLAADGPAAIVIDGYDFGADYQRGARALGAPTLVIDDYHHFENYSADLVLNQNLHAAPDLYRGDDVAGLLLGPRYALLGSEFADGAAPKVRDMSSPARRVLVMFGGSDQGRGTMRVLEALASLPLVLDVVALVAVSNADETVLEHTLDRPWIQREGLTVRIEYDSTSVRQWMRWADVGVLAAGSTVWEAMASGLASVLVSVAPNQRPGAGAAHFHGAAESLGDLDEIPDEDLALALDRYLRDRDRQRAHAETAAALVDGKGASRVFASLTHWAELPRPYRLVRANASHELPLLEIVNEPTVRAASLSTEPISLSSHRPWFRARIASADTCLWALEHDGLLAGYIRYDRLGNGEGEVHFALGEAHRRKGLGGWLLRATREIARSELGLTVSRGIVKPNNQASAAAFRRAGYRSCAPVQHGGEQLLCFENLDDPHA